MKGGRNQGIIGEDIAITFLLKHGFDIICRNYRYKHFEIDIIAKKEKCIHFCEVKFRKGVFFGYPESFVSSSQQKRIKSAAEEFLFQNNWEGAIRFDIISINSFRNTSQEEIKFFEDAFF